jgi:hypothetical protein
MRKRSIVHGASLTWFLIFCNRFVVGAVPFGRLNPKATPNQETPHRLYAKHCGRTYEEVERTLDRDHFMDTESARDWGLIDRVLPTRSEAELFLASGAAPFL